MGARKTREEAGRTLGPVTVRGDETRPVGTAREVGFLYSGFPCVWRDAGFPRRVAGAGVGRAGTRLSGRPRFPYPR